MADVAQGERRQLAPPVVDTGAIGWMRKNLFSSWGNALTTIVLGGAVGWILAGFIDGAVINAVWTAPTGQDCRGAGACWALIHEKYRYIFFGSFPYQQHLRPLLAVLTMLVMLISSADRRMWNSRLLWIWAIGTFVTFLLMFGVLSFSISFFLFVALVAGAIGLLTRGVVAEPAELNAYRALAGIGIIGLILRYFDILP